MKRSALRVLAVVAAAAACDAAPPPAAAPAAGAVAFERAFPRRSFERPLFLTTAPGDARLFVVTQAGAIEAFDPADDRAPAQPFLDIRRKVSRRGEEEGLLGLAFHPDYARNGLLYVYYSAAGAPRQVVAQYRAPDRRTADPASERILLEMPDPWRNHNGGMLAFGPDGHLYVGTGDGGSGGDPQGNGQRLDTLLGKILRLTAEGGVPPDNPFAGKAGARGEIWAYGLRNPWRFSFDRATGVLWAGDVGQNRWEEVDVIEKGGNYGWRAFEAFEAYDKAAAGAGTGFIAPVAAYGHDLGCSITGGYVYRGAAVPSLRGQYLYADFCSGKVWALRAEGAGRRDGRLIATVPSPSSFGEDAAGELYVTSFDGGLYRLTQK